MLRGRNFRRFYLGQVTSLLGTSMSAVAVIFAVLDNGGSAADVGYVIAARILPQVALVLGGGVLADRLGRRPVMLGSDVLRCAAQAVLAAALLAGRPAIWQFAALAALVGIGEAFFQPALDGLTVEIAPREELGSANALLGLARSGTGIAGPALAGVLVAVRAGRGGRDRRGQLRGERDRARRAATAAGRAPARHIAAAGDGGGLGRVQVPALAVGDHGAVRAVQHDHLGAVPGARPGPGP